MGKTELTKRKRISKPADERITDLRNAARKIFFKKGIQDTTIEEITDAADVSKGTFYLYFNSKEQIVSAIWERYIDDFLEMGEEILNNESVSISDRLIQTFERLSEYVLDNADLHLIFYRRAEDTIRRDANERLFVAITDLVVRGVETGELSAENPNLLIRILFHGMGGALHDAIDGSRPVDRDELTRTAGHLVRVTFSIAD